MGSFLGIARSNRRLADYKVTSFLRFDGSNDIVVAPRQVINSPTFSLVAILDQEGNYTNDKYYSILNATSNVAPYDGFVGYINSQGKLATYNDGYIIANNTTTPIKGKFLAYWEQNPNSFNVAVNNNQPELICDQPFANCLMGGNSNLRIGATKRSLFAFDGKQYMLALFNRALTANERKYIYNNGRCNRLPLNFNGLISLWLLGFTCPITGLCPDLMGINHGVAENFDLNTAIQSDKNNYIKVYGGKKITWNLNPSVSYILPNKLNKQANTIPEGWSIA